MKTDSGLFHPHDENIAMPNNYPHKPDQALKNKPFPSIHPHLKRSNFAVLVPHP